jgi:hypothetical protein
MKIKFMNTKHHEVSEQVSCSKIKEARISTASGFKYIEKLARQSVQ